MFTHVIIRPAKCISSWLLRIIVQLQFEDSTFMKIIRRVLLFRDNKFFINY